jgi:hypothetical protein
VALIQRPVEADSVRPTRVEPVSVGRDPLASAGGAGGAVAAYTSPTVSIAKQCWGSLQASAWSVPAPAIVVVDACVVPTGSNSTIPSPASIVRQCVAAGQISVVGSD